MSHTREIGWRWQESTSGGGTDLIRLVQIEIPYDATISSIKIILGTNAGTHLAHAVLYDDNAGAPGNLVLDGGETTIPTSSTGDVHEAWSGSQNVSAGKYWLGFHFDTSPSVGVTLDLVSGNSISVSRTYESGALDPWSGGSGSTTPYDFYLECVPQVEFDGTTQVGEYLAIGPGNWVGGNNEIDVKKFTLGADGDITAVLADIGRISNWAANEARPVIYDDNLNAPGNLLATGPSVAIGPGMMDLQLTSPLAVLTSDIVWVGIHQESLIYFSDAANTGRASFGSSAYAGGAPDPFPSPNTADSRDMALGYALDEGGGAPVGGGGQSFRIMVGM